MEKAKRRQWRDRLILENALDYAILTTDINGVIDSWSAGAQKLFGWREDEIIGRPLDYLFTEEDQLSGLPAKRRETARQYRLDPVERWHRRKDGSLFWASGDLQLFLNENDEPWGFLKIVRDRTTEREHAEALRLSEERVRLAQEAAGIGAFAIDKDRMVILTTPKFNELLGMKPCEEIPFNDLVGVIAERGDNLADEMLDPPEGTLVHLEFPICRVDNGQLRWLAYWAETAPTDTGSVNAERILGVLQDITERRAAQEKKDILARELAHRVKNILAIVQSIGNQSLNRATTLDDARQAFSARLSALANAQDILVHGASHSIDLEGIVVRCLGLHAGENTGFICSGPPTALEAEAALSMSLALHELGTNALKYGALSIPNGKVEVSWGFDKGQFYLLWQEKDGPEVNVPTHKGFGSKLVERLLPASLNGTATLEFTRTGFSYRLDAPQSELVHPALQTSAA